MFKQNKTRIMFFEVDLTQDVAVVPLRVNVNNVNVPDIVPVEKCLKWFTADLL